MNPDGNDMLIRLGYGLASSLVGAAICLAMLVLADIRGAWQLFAILMLVSFLGGLLFGKRFFDFTKELLHKIW